MSPGCRVSLAVADAGARVRVCSVSGRDAQAQRLRELGVLEGKTIRVVSNSNPLIFQVGESRLGVCHRLARCVLVEPLPVDCAIPA